MFKRKRSLVGLATVLVSVLMLSAAATAASKAPVTQSFDTDAGIQKGMIVRLDAKDKGKVDALTFAESKHMYGVVVAANDAALSLTSDTNSPQSYVATYGTYDVLVSTQNGPISPNDFISISNIDGIGMKADEAELAIIGRAQNSFNGNSNVVSTTELSDQSGHKTKVSIGLVKVEIAVQNNPLHSAGLPSQLTQFLNKLGYAIGDRPVQPARLYLGILLLIITAVIAGVLLFSGVRNTMVSVGRNPLAKKAIFKSLIQVVLTALIVFIIGIFAVYLLLKL
jgi:hypothetical protein